MNEKFSTNTEKREDGEMVRGLDVGEIEKMKLASEKFVITRDFYRKAAFDSAEEMLKEWLKIKEIKKFQREYQNSCPQS